MDILDKNDTMYPIGIHLGYFWIYGKGDFFRFIFLPNHNAHKKTKCPFWTFFGQLFLSQKTRKWTKKSGKKILFFYENVLFVW